MAKRRKVSEEKKETIVKLIEMLDIQLALKDLLGDIIQNILESEMDEHLEYEPYERLGIGNPRNSYFNKYVNLRYF